MPFRYYLYDDHPHKFDTNETSWVSYHGSEMRSENAGNEISASSWRK